MKDKIKAFLREVNKCTKMTKVVRDEENSSPSLRCSTKCFHFCLTLKTDPFIQDCGTSTPINVSGFFDKTIRDAGIKYFGKTPTFNNTHTNFWFFIDTPK